MTHEQVEEAVKLRLEGATYPALAERYGTNIKTVYRRLVGRVPMKKVIKAVAAWPDHVIRDAHRRCMLGEDQKKVADELGISLDAFRAACFKRGLPPMTFQHRWSKKVLREAHNRYQCGESRESIAKSLGAPRWEFVYRAMHRIGLKTRTIGARERRHDDIGYKTYALRVQGLSFKEISERIPLSNTNPEATLSRAMYRYCRRCGIPAPPRNIAISRAARAASNERSRPSPTLETSRLPQSTSEPRPARSWSSDR
jgi:hypothetical protein